MHWGQEGNWQLICHVSVLNGMFDSQHMISRRPALSHTGGEVLGDLVYLSAEPITSCGSTAAALPAEQTCGHVQPHPPDYQSVALIRCYDFICHSLWARLTMTEVTVFSCLLSTHFAAARLTRPTKRCLRSPCPAAGTPQSLLFLNIVTLQLF